MYIYIHVFDCKHMLLATHQLIPIFLPCGLHWRLQSPSMSRVARSVEAGALDDFCRLVALGKTLVDLLFH